MSQLHIINSGDVWCIAMVLMIRTRSEMKITTIKKEIIHIIRKIGNDTQNKYFYIQNKIHQSNQICVQFSMQCHFYALLVKLKWLHRISTERAVKRKIISYLMFYSGKFSDIC